MIISGLFWYELAMSCENQSWSSAQGIELRILKSLIVGSYIWVRCIYLEQLTYWGVWDMLYEALYEGALSHL